MAPKSGMTAVTVFWHGAKMLLWTSLLVGAIGEGLVIDGSVNPLIDDSAPPAQMRLGKPLAAGCAAGNCLAQSTFSPVRLPAVPLAVKSPYLNSWLQAPTDGGERGYLAGRHPQFWTQAVTGWQGYVKVDGKNYNWMGAYEGGRFVEQTSLNVTAARSIFTVNAGEAVELNIEFLSPVYPDDLLRQSITSSYLEVSIKSIDGKNHDVQLYADVSGEWCSGDHSAVIEWEKGTRDGTIYHKFWRQDQEEFKEESDQASWGNWYWATGDKGGVTYQIGSDADVRKEFLDNGRLKNKIDSDFRPINQEWPVFAFARDLGKVSGKSSVSTLFTIGYTQENAIIFQGKSNQPIPVPSYWAQSFAEEDVVSVFFNDWGHAQKIADALDEQIFENSRAVAGDDYVIITTASVRQAFAALAYTGTKDRPLVWQKEISSASFVQTVDVLYPTWPFMLYFDPNLIKYTLAPLIENQESGNYPNQYAMLDLGRYPSAIGYPKGDDEPMPLEESADMIIMMLSYAQKAKDTDYLKEHLTIMEQWAEFLIEDAKIPADQLSTDDFAGKLANQTNLAIKGIIGLQAMSEIEKLTGHSDKQKDYAKIAADYLKFWRRHGIAADANPPHSTLQYDKPETYGLLYNVFADKALGLNFIPDPIYDMLDTFYPTIMQKYGVVLDTRHTWTKLDWEMWTAAVLSVENRDDFVGTIAKWIGATPSYRPLTDLYDVNSGDFADGIQFNARPVVGGVFSLLAF